MTLLLNIKLLIINIIILIVSFIKNYSSDFINFLLDKNIIQTCIGILLSGQIIILTSTITNNIINPILKRLSFTEKEFEDIKYERFGIQFDIGKIFTNLFTFFIVGSIIFYIWNLTNITDLSSVNNMLNNTNTNLISQASIISSIINENSENVL